MMNSKSRGLLTRVVMFAMVVLMAFPVVALAQGRNDDWWRVQRRQDRREDRRDRNRDWRNNRRQNDDGYGNYGGSIHLRQTALNAGFADGVKEGRKDRNKNEQFEFRDEGNFQSATRDYSSRLGNRELYRTYYRQAFENGYRDGYAGY